ncbi:uncharacterized protein LOC101235034 isoform X1 [Hydra vulgaris]|uniref:uncharacterized protein LOC101235034 isoform X1 n=1 Tax=Hydra vulgaris TaxID=6087 RepID=UPI0002B498D8|nr:uncharacterized protein LOC101235034 [Hydra vulgaris]
MLCSANEMDVSGLVSRIPVSFVFWLCLCHLWIILSSLVYMKTEGCEVKQVNLVDLYLLKFFSSNNQKLLDITSPGYKEFKDGYEQAKKQQNYWQVRGKFNDFSKVYIFVLSSVTTIGMESMFLQTWQSQCFYLFSTPVGFILYSIMIYKFGNKFYNVLYTAASHIYSKGSPIWTTEEHVLYRKLKVMIIAIYLFIFYMLLLALLALTTDYNYIYGMYWMLNTMLTINGPSLDCVYEFLHLGIVAFITSVVYFFGLEFFYLVCLSAFSVFGHDNPFALMSICNCVNHVEELAIIEEVEKKHNEAILYLNAKIAAEAIQMEWDSSEHAIDSDNYFFPSNIKKYITSSDSSSNESLKESKRQKKRRKLTPKNNQTLKEKNIDEEVVYFNEPTLEISPASSVDWLVVESD